MEADSELSAARTSYRDEQLRNDHERVRDARARGTGLQWAEDSLRAAENRMEISFQPSWYLVTKGDRVDTPSGSIEDVIPSIEVPGRYVYATAILRGGKAEIDITLSSSGPSITLTGTDEAWLRHAERWAEEAIKKYRTHWWWLLTWRGFIFTTLSGVGAYFLLLNTLPLVGAPRDVAALVGLAADWGVLLAIFTLTSRFRASIIEPETRQTKTILTQGGLLLAGAILGVIVSRITEILFPS